MNRANQARQATPRGRLRSNRTSLARHGCALRSAARFDDLLPVGHRRRFASMFEPLI
jgi:hypothetical protein